MEYIETHGDMKEETYAAIIYDSIYIPGDERSRTHPGHGYDAHSEKVIKLISFESKEELENWISVQSQSVVFQPVIIRPLNVKRTVSVE